MAHQLQASSRPNLVERSACAAPLALDPGQWIEPVALPIPGFHWSGHPRAMITAAGCGVASAAYSAFHACGVPWWAMISGAAPGEGPARPKVWPGWHCLE